MTRVGIVGLGFMGMVHYETYSKMPHVDVVAMVDNDPVKLGGDWRGIKGNFGPQGELMDLSEIATYESANGLIANPDVDVVDITLPPSFHADVAVDALRGGKHVFCEKPMAMSLDDCDRMVHAANKAERHLLIGHVLPFFPEYAWALREIRSGHHGRVTGASFKRVISDPTWLSNYWSAVQVGGPLLDLHVHDAHFIRLACGMPDHVVSRGARRNGVPSHWHSLMTYDDSDCVVQATSGVIEQQGRPFLHGFEIRLEKATLVFEFAVMGDREEYLCPPTILGYDGRVDQADLGDGDPMLAFKSELDHVIRVVRGEAQPDGLSCELARDAIGLCQLQAESLDQVTYEPDLTDA